MANKRNGRRFLSILLALVFLISTMSLSVSAASRPGNGGGGGGEDSGYNYEWIQVIVQGKEAHYSRGEDKDDGYLIKGTYTYTTSVVGSTLYWTVGNVSGSIDLSLYVDIPAGYTVGSYQADIVVSGTNSQGASYDNAVLTITIETLLDEDDNEVDIDEIYPELTIEKTANKEVYNPGETITWTIVVKNVGKADATNVTVTDEFTGDSWTIDTLAVGESKTFIATSVVPADAKDGDTITNAAVATYSEGTVEDDETVEVDVPVVLYPKLTIVKTADKAVYNPGETITWTITVKNIGDAVAENVVVTDEFTDDSWTIATLAVGETKTFTATSVVPLDAADGSTIRNVAVATTGNDTVQDDETVEVDVPVILHPEIIVLKTADKEVYNPGETITWTITVKNIGKGVANDVTVTDEFTGDKWTIATLAAGETKTFTTTSVVPLNAADGSTIRNVAVATYDNKTEEDEEIVEVEVLYPEIIIEKTSDKEVYQPGETITWTITVKNIGEAAAQNVVVTDAFTGDEWTIDTLAVGESKSFTTTSVVPTDAENGAVIRNVAVVTHDNKTEEDEEIIEVLYPEITIDKTADKQSYEPGETITWTITVKNIGEADAKNVVVTDSFTGDSWTIDTLAAGASKSFTTTTVVPANAENGAIIRNVAVVTHDNKTEEDEETVEVLYPEITIDKIADKEVYNPGETITWTITVKNIGQAAAENVVVTDEFTGDEWIINILPAGESKTFTATSVVPLDATHGSKIRNVAVATLDNDTVEDDETVEVDVPVILHPEIIVLKTADKKVYNPGETITWTITVKNIGEGLAENITVTDEFTDDEWFIEALAAGQSLTFTVTSVVPADAEDGSTIRNVAVVTHDNKTKDDEEIVEVEVLYPEIIIEKTADKEVYEPGETITWTITVKNIGEAAAENVVVTDAFTGDEWTIDTLAVGESKSFTTTSVVPLDAENGAIIRNVAVVTHNNETTEDEEIVEILSPEIVITKTADKAVYKPGETIIWTITVKNIGEADAENVTVIDELTRDEWFIEVLAAGESVTFTAYSTISIYAADGTVIRNVAVASSGDKTVEDDETVEVEVPFIPVPPPVNPPVNPPSEPDTPPVDPPSEPDTPPVDPPSEPDEPVDIPDEDVPLADLPDEDVPLADVPQTGGVMMLSIGGAISSSLGLVVLALKKKSEDE